jgi:hypothetical protein
LAGGRLSGSIVGMLAHGPVVRVRNASP